MAVQPYCLNKEEEQHYVTHTHTRTHARTHARAHAHTLHCLLCTTSWRVEVDVTVEHRMTGTDKTTKFW